jgi:hypothetical protein
MLTLREDVLEDRREKKGVRIIKKRPVRQTIEIDVCKPAKAQQVNGGSNGRE